MALHPPGRRWQRQVLACSMCAKLASSQLVVVAKNEQSPEVVRVGQGRQKSPEVVVGGCLGQPPPVPSTSITRTVVCAATWASQQHAAGGRNKAPLLRLRTFVQRYRYECYVAGDYFSASPSSAGGPPLGGSSRRPDSARLPAALAVSARWAHEPQGPRQSKSGYGIVTGQGSTRCYVA